MTRSTDTTAAHVAANRRQLLAAVDQNPYLRRSNEKLAAHRAAWLARQPTGSPPAPGTA